MEVADQNTPLRSTVFVGAAVTTGGGVEVGTTRVDWVEGEATCCTTFVLVDVGIAVMTGAVCCVGSALATVVGDERTALADVTGVGCEAVVVSRRGTISTAPTVNAMSAAMPTMGPTFDRVGIVFASATIALGVRSGIVI
jgi:hypothetical protein